ncbi:cell division protein SepF [Paratractidigestivibacter sp.]|uniref:cell division protein SepF n=1 Tax=Paratractidigestivibacter sp. TaxID=2847316 RepID=UPI002ABD74E1|nr:cell division protein SepF [Paratractidigestivibacter sp.]
MGFLDSIRDRFAGNNNDDFYDDDEFYEDEGSGYSDNRRDTGSSPRLLGNTPRPVAESVSVYTRSGRPVANQVPTSLPSTAQGTYDTRETNSMARGGYQSPTAPVPVPARSEFGGAARRVSSSGQLPPYVLRPVAYDDAQTVVRRVKTNQPVVLVFRNTNIEVAKRILDFSFGFSMGIDGEVSELGDRCFAVLPAGAKLSATDINKLIADGDLDR